MTRLAVARLETPLGPMVAAATGTALAVLEFADGPRAERQVTRAEREAAVARTNVGIAEHEILAALSAWLAAYFDGVRTPFVGRLDPVGTPFQRRCWEWLRIVPSGETRTYTDAALALGTSPRAFAAANGANPLAIVVPCHRIVGIDGNLTGYGGGLDRKASLLSLERNAG